MTEPIEPRSRSRFAAVNGCPKSSMRPTVGKEIPASVLNSVVLPTPFGPMTAQTSPAETDRVQSRIISRPAIVFPRPVTVRVVLVSVMCPFLPPHV